MWDVKIVQLNARLGAQIQLKAALYTIQIDSLPGINISYALVDSRFSRPVA